MQTRLHDLRVSSGLTIRQLAEAVGYHYSTISMLENDKIDPAANTIICFCDYFKCTIDYFLYRSDIREISNGFSLKQDALNVALEYEKLTPSQQLILKSMIKEMRK